MKKERRKKVTRIVEVAAVAVVVLDLAVYFLAVRPLHAKISRGENAYHQASVRLEQQRVLVDRMEKFQKSLPAADRKLTDYLKQHVPTRQRVFSDADRLVRELTQKSGVQLQGISYKLSSEKDEPFDRLGLDVTVEGQFPSLLRFAHSLESADDLILVRNFSFAAGQKGTVSLRVGGVLYLSR